MNDAKIQMNFRKNTNIKTAPMCWKSEPEFIFSPERG